MDSEKIISSIMEKVGNTDVSQQTITMLMGLSPLAEGVEPDDAYFSKMADAAKSVQGNINHVFSEKLAAQVEARVKERIKDAPKPNDGSEDDTVKKLKSEMEEAIRKWGEERSEWEKEKAEKTRKETVSAVKSELEDMFSEAGTQVNRYFLKSALSKLEIPEKDADVKALAKKAEEIYNADMKEANIGFDSPRNGGGGGWSRPKSDEHIFDDIVQARAKYRPKAQS